jgi:hypothetical protein
VLLRDHQQVHRRGRVDVLEREQFVVFVHHASRNLFGDDLAENAVVHVLSSWVMAPPCAAFSSMPALILRGAPAFSSSPEMPSRAPVLISTCCGVRPNCASSTIEWNHRSAHFVQHLGSVAAGARILGRHHGFGGFLADLLQDRVVALGEQLG